MRLVPYETPMATPGPRRAPAAPRRRQQQQQQPAASAEATAALQAEAQALENADIDAFIENAPTKPAPVASYAPDTHELFAQLQSSISAQIVNLGAALKAEMAPATAVPRLPTGMTTKPMQEIGKTLATMAEQVKNAESGE